MTFWGVKKKGKLTYHFRTRGRWIIQANDILESEKNGKLNAPVKNASVRMAATREKFGSDPPFFPESSETEFFF